MLRVAIMLEDHRTISRLNRKGRNQERYIRRYRRIEAHQFNRKE
jgi:hypothetical protein